MMLLDEDQISFSFASSMVDDNIEDYSHQIAEMIGLRNESYLVQAGVSKHPLLYNYKGILFYFLFLNWDNFAYIKMCFCHR